jgi:hypothetical protein
MIAIRVRARPRYRRYLGNGDPGQREVHDLHAEDARCAIAEIIAAGQAVIFDPDRLPKAHGQGFQRCPYCIPNSTE